MFFSSSNFIDHTKRQCRVQRTNIEKIQFEVFPIFTVGLRTQTSVPAMIANWMDLPVERMAAPVRSQEWLGA